MSLGSNFAETWNNVLRLGNKKLGKDLIWGFGLPSISTCPGASETCARICYSYRLEQYRRKVYKSNLANLRRSHREEFVAKVQAFIDLNDCEVVRIHTSGDYYSRKYALKWLEIMKACLKTRFYFYTRSWRIPEICQVMERMARLKNVRVWYSIDRDTGTPERVPRRVRLAYLQANPADRPPAGVHLVFRPAEMRRKPQTQVDGVRVCPSEDGVERTVKVHCGNCSICHREMPVSSMRGLLSLPVFPA